MEEKRPGLRGERIGRNDPCRCGSGKKYKKCRLARDESHHRQEREAPLEYEPGGESWEPKLEMSPYVLAKTLDDPEIVHTLPPEERSLAWRKWSPWETHGRSSTRPRLPRD